MTALKTSVGKKANRVIGLAREGRGMLQNQQEQNLREGKSQQRRPVNADKKSRDRGRGKASREEMRQKAWGSVLEEGPSPAGSELGRATWGD